MIISSTSSAKKYLNFSF